MYCSFLLKQYYLSFFWEFLCLYSIKLFQMPMLQVTERRLKGFIGWIVYPNNSLKSSNVFAKME